MYYPMTSSISNRLVALYGSDESIINNNNNNNEICTYGTMFLTHLFFPANIHRILAFFGCGHSDE